MNEKVLDFIKTVGVPSAIALGLAWMLHEQQVQAAEERAGHSAMLLNEMSAMRHACDPKAP